MKPPQVAVNQPETGWKVLSGKPKKKESELEKILRKRENPFNYDPNQVIDSARYKINKDKSGKHVILGKGTWGVVLRLYDKLTKEFVAGKFHLPTKTALEQLDYREKTHELEFRKEGGTRKSKACANVVPTDYEKDAQGRPFLVMPEYKLFLSDIVKQASQRDRTKSRKTEFGDLKPLESGLYLDEVIHIWQGLPVESFD